VLYVGRCWTESLAGRGPPADLLVNAGQTLFASLSPELQLYSIGYV
jgi:hypothetical protein